jgi:hypothetical protein
MPKVRSSYITASTVLFAAPVHGFMAASRRNRREPGWTMSEIVF